MPATCACHATMPVMTLRRASARWCSPMPRARRWRGSRQRGRGTASAGPTSQTCQALQSPTRAETTARRWRRCWRASTLARAASSGWCTQTMTWPSSGPACCACWRGSTPPTPGSSQVGGLACRRVGGWLRAAVPDAGGCASPRPLNALAAPPADAYWSRWDRRHQQRAAAAGKRFTGLRSSQPPKANQPRCVPCSLNTTGGAGALGRSWAVG